MKIIYPYHYDVNEIPPRCRNPRPVQYTAELEVEIREPSVTEAPVALIQHSRYRWSEEETPWHVHPFRWYEGQLWVQRDPGPDHKERERYTLSVPAEPRYVCRYSWDQLGDQKAQSEEHIREWATEQILIDGQIWRPFPEPLIKASKVDSWHNPGTYQMAVEYYTRGYGNQLWYYPLTMWDTVYSTLQSLVEEDEKFWRPDNYRFEILIPEAIRWPVHYQYEFQIGGNGIEARLQVEAASDEEALTRLREGLSSAYPTLNTRCPDNTLLSNLQVSFLSADVTLDHLVRRVSGLGKLTRAESEDPYAT